MSKSLITSEELQDFMDLELTYPLPVNPAPFRQILERCLEAIEFYEDPSALPAMDSVLERLDKLEKRCPPSLHPQPWRSIPYPEPTPYMVSDVPPVKITSTFSGLDNDL